MITLGFPITAWRFRTFASVVRVAASGKAGQRSPGRPTPRLVVSTLRHFVKNSPNTYPSLSATPPSNSIPPRPLGHHRPTDRPMKLPRRLWPSTQAQLGGQARPAGVVGRRTPKFPVAGPVAFRSGSPRKAGYSADFRGFLLIQAWMRRGGKSSHSWQGTSDGRPHTAMRRPSMTDLGATSVNHAVLARMEHSPVHPRAIAMADRSDSLLPESLASNPFQRGVLFIGAPLVRTFVCSTTGMR